MGKEFETNTADAVLGLISELYDCPNLVDSFGVLLWPNQVHLMSRQSLTAILALVPTQLKFGAGSFAEAGRISQCLGRRVLMVTTRNAMERLGHAQQLLDDLHRHGIEVVRFREFRLSPTTEDIDRGAALARSFAAELIVSLGGGSVIDCGKAIAAVAVGNRPTSDYLYGRAAVPPNTLPLLAIPTTAGTGSEMNCSAIVTDPKRPFKDGIRSPYLFPRCAIVDPILTCGASRELTARTGFDVLSHAVESYVSPKAQPATDELALDAVRVVSRFLPIVLESPEDVDAREQLAWGSATMGINLARVGTCFPHRADKALCALHPEIPHGQSVALFYPNWARSCCRGNVERFARLTEILRPDLTGLSTDAKALAFAEVVAQFIDRIGLSRRMADFGATTDEIPRLVENVAGDLTVNPIPVERSSLPGIFRELLTESGP
jgi:alcohol dehydrogenase class IV